jgi:hypothetical protein
MPNPTSTAVDQGFIALGDNAYRDELVKFGGIATLKAGTIMARDTGDGTLVPFVIGGVTAGNGVPDCVLPDALTSTGAGNLPFRAIISGRVNRTRLVVDAAGDASTLTGAIEATLRARSIVPERVDQIAS